MMIIIYIILFALAASLMAKIGVIIFWLYGGHPRGPFIQIVQGFTSGSLVGASLLFFLSAIPEPSSILYGQWVLIGLSLYIPFDFFMKKYPYSFYTMSDNEKAEKGEPKVFKQLLESLIQYLIYGLMISFSLLYSLKEGMILSTVIILRLYPEAIKNMGLLKKGCKARRAIVASFLTPFNVLLGAMIALVIHFTKIWPVSFVEPLLGFIVGVLLYLGLSDLATLDDSQGLNLLLGILGLIIMIFLWNYVS